MKRRAGVVTLALTAALTLGACSSSLPGVPSGPAGDSAEVTTELTTDSDAQVAPDDAESDDALPDSSDSTLPSINPSDLSDATDALSALEDYMSGDCMTVAGLTMSLGLMMVAPMMGGTELTESDITEAFSGIPSVPAELTGAVETVRQAALAAVGKPTANAADILGSDEVSGAMDQLSDYLDKNCSSE